MSETCTARLPHPPATDHKGMLIAIEGTDWVCLSAHVDLLRSWLEEQGLPVLVSQVKRLDLSNEDFEGARECGTPANITRSLVDAIELSDLLEHEILPALDSGFVVLCERYIYSLIARARLRGVDPAWLRDTYSFARRPDAVLYLRIGVDELIRRAVIADEPDDWAPQTDVDSSTSIQFLEYQSSLLSEFEVLAQEYSFQIVDAGQQDLGEVFRELQAQVDCILKNVPIETQILRKALLTKSPLPSTPPFDPRKTQLLIRRTHR